MTNTILIKDDKSLVKTVSRPIHEGENRVDEIQFLFGDNLFPNFTKDIVVMLQAILPYPDEEAGTDTTGKMRYMEIDEELYKEKYRMELPITSVLTKAAGDVIFWFMFFDVSDPEHIVLLKTDSTTIRIDASLKDSSSAFDDDKTYDVLATLQRDVEELKKSRMDKVFEYNEDDQTIQFYSNGNKCGEPVRLDTEVSWKNWEE